MTFKILGPQVLQSGVGLDKDYFKFRDILVDNRGTLEIDNDTHWGWDITIITQSHDFSSGKIGERIDRPVIVRKGAFIGSRSFLYNCTISENAIVAAGAVVASCIVYGGVIVAGNPARVVARWLSGEWVWTEPKYRHLL